MGKQPEQRAPWGKAGWEPWATTGEAQSQSLDTDDGTKSHSLRRAARAGWWRPRLHHQRSSPQTKVSTSRGKPEATWEAPQGPKSCEGQGTPFLCCTPKRPGPKWGSRAHRQGPGVAEGCLSPLELAGPHDSPPFSSGGGPSGSCGGEAGSSQGVRGPRSPGTCPWPTARVVWAPGCRPSKGCGWLSEGARSEAALPDGDAKAGSALVPGRRALGHGKGRRTRGEGGFWWRGLLVRCTPELGVEAGLGRLAGLKAQPCPSRIEGVFYLWVITPLAPTVVLELYAVQRRDRAGAKLLVV